MNIFFKKEFKLPTGRYGTLHVVFLFTNMLTLTESCMPLSHDSFKERGARNALDQLSAVGL